MPNSSVLFPKSHHGPGETENIEYIIYEVGSWTYAGVVLDGMVELY